MNKKKYTQNRFTELFESFSNFVNVFVDLKRNKPTIYLTLVLEMMRSVGDV